MAVDAAAFRDAMARLPAGVTVLTTGDGPHVETLTASSVTSVSLDPTLILASIGAHSQWLRAVRRTRQFVVNVLGGHQAPLADWCASALRHTSYGDERVRLADSVAALDCDLYAEHAAGDHVLLLGEVMQVRLGGCQPSLVLVNRQYAAVSGAAS